MTPITVGIQAIRAARKVSVVGADSRDDVVAAMGLRLATEADRDLLLALRNEPETVAASRQGAVTASEHASWLEQALRDGNRHLLIALLDGVPIGQVRFDRLHGYRYEISVSLDPAARGRGLGRRLIEGACEWLWVATNASGIDANVSKGNAPSLRSFERAGFRRAGESDEPFLVLCLGRPEPFAAERPSDRVRHLPFLG